MRPDFFRADGDWSPLRLGRIGRLVAGAGFPHEFQGVEDAELPFFKVGDTNLPGNERELRSATNTVSRQLARQLGARVCPAGAIAFPKVGATLLGNKRRLTVRDCIFDNNMMALVPYRDHDPRFLLYALGDVDFGQLSNPGPVPSINAGDLKDVLLPIPAACTQRRIALFLDRKTAAIDALIAKKERLIDLLQEKRQALITQAVTKGLDPNVPMKDCAVTCLGTIPSHWRLLRLKQLSHRISGRLVYQPAQYFSDEGVPFIMGNNVTERGISLEQTKFIPSDVNARFAHHALRTGDVVMVRVGAPGVTAVVVPEADGLNCGSLMIVRRNDAFHSVWLAALMNSPSVRAQIDLVQYGAAQEQINITDAVNFWIPTPPLEEQRAIADFVRRSSNEINRTADRVVEQVARLHEYRQALITAAVTGKIDLSKEAS